MKREIDSLPQVDDTKSCPKKSNGTMDKELKRRRISPEVDGSHLHSSSPNTASPDLGSIDESLSTEMINSQIFMEGNKSSVKLTVFAELYSCSDCGEV